MGDPRVAPVGERRHKVVACSFAARWKNQREDGMAAGLLDRINKIGTAIWWRKELKELRRDGWICREIGEYCSRLLLGPLNWRKEQRRDSRRRAVA
jgi:hypothetical protein